ncbi:archease [archaeon]|jgi:SHS2 domain-containing protein|nr:archease [archaeon]
MEKFEFLEHTADIKFQAFGETLEEAFSNSALALSNSITEEKIKSKKELKFQVKGKNMENLLYNFLEEFLFLFDSESFLLSKVKEMKINKEKFELSCVVEGDEANKYSFHSDIKAITYNEMFIKKEKHWIIQGVFDV